MLFLIKAFISLFGIQDFMLLLLVAKEDSVTSYYCHIVIYIITATNRLPCNFMI